MSTHPISETIAGEAPDCHRHTRVADCDNHIRLLMLIGLIEGVDS